MKSLVVALVSLSCATVCLATPPSFRATSVPEGWVVVKGEADPGSVRSAKPALPVELRTAQPMVLPLDATIRFRIGLPDTISIAALDEAKDAKPLLMTGFRMIGPNQMGITAQASGVPMATTPISTRTYSIRGQGTGTLNYQWRFPKVKNLWDEVDRKEIGAAYARLTPLEEKTFTLRLVLTSAGRQIWIDDRLVAEAQVETPAKAIISITLAKSAQVIAADFGKPVDQDRFLPLPLAHYSHAKPVQLAEAKTELAKVNQVPMYVPQTSLPDISLGDSLYRYRRTHGAGPETGYVNALRVWPSTFEVDPATLAFRVPYRAYQNAWLLAWVDSTANAVPKGAFRFFRPVAGYPAATEFEISDEAIAKGLVTKLPQQTADGKQLYLVKVPVDTGNLFGFRDMADQFLEFELTKPLALGRSYPDPIYYGYHPAGPPSSIHVVGITLEESPFSYDVTPAQANFVFEKPERPTISVPVTNASDKPLAATVTLRTKSYDGSEQKVATQKATIAPGKTDNVELKLDLEKLGWHELHASVEARGAERHNTLSLVLLPPNTRTYGDAPNEVRFGTWNLLGHYTPLAANAADGNEPILAMLRKLGLRRIAYHGAFVKPEAAKKYDLLPTGPHTVINVVYRWKEDDDEGQKKMIETELAAVDELTKQAAKPTYFYGGEWHLGRNLQYASRPFFTGEGDLPLTEEEQKNAHHQIKIFTKIGTAIREKYPQTKLILQWGAPLGTSAYLRSGLSKNVVDAYGMDAPMFELLPEISNMTGCINNLWGLRQEIKRLGWPQLPIHWCEGPFFPTNPGALSETDQLNYQLRYLLLGLSYGIDGFEAGVVPFDAGNYYGAEHYGAGVFHRHPLGNPKPAVAAIATMTSMLCGADPRGGLDTGNLTTYCMSFERAKDKAKIYALWRIRGTADAAIKVAGTKATLTDAMGNAQPLPVKDGAITVKVGSSPVWLTDVERIESIKLGDPTYDSAPGSVTKPLVDFLPTKWEYDGSEDKAYATNHFAVRRITDEYLKAEFGQGEEGHPDAVAITLPVEPGTKPLATRYGSLKLKTPVGIPGKASALGLWVKGNSSWGRIAYQLRDAKGEIWTSIGTKDDWNCDDTQAWSYVNFEGWRYVRFPLPGNHVYDGTRDLETTWWGSRGGDGYVDLPLSVEKIFVEARNEVPNLGEMKLVPERSYKLSHLVAEYTSDTEALPAALAKYKYRMPVPVWVGPAENAIARLTVEGSGAAPDIRKFEEPTHFNDGRRMVVHFDEAADLKYNLYLSIYPDGRGADLLKAGVKNGDTVTGFKPETPLFLFLTAVTADKRESKPSKAFPLTTHDNFAEK